MPALPLRDVLDATGGELRGPLDPATVFGRIELDPGAVRRGDLFLPVPGERLDGHEFTVVAAARGAAAAVVARQWADGLEERPLPLVVVDTPVDALHRIAAAWRARLPTTVVGITGSVGKTSTKELLAAVLGRRFATYRSPGNRNNELGLPLSVLEIEPETEVAVLELGGGYAAGELALLARIARPRIAVVTNVFPVHVERMGSLEALAEAKAELVDAVPPDGAAVLNGDDPRVRAMAARCRGAVVTFGLGAGNDVRAAGLSTRGLDGSSFELALGGERRRVDVPLAGPHVVELALAAVAAGHALGLTLAEASSALERPGVAIGPSPLCGPNGSVLLDDTYSSSRPAALSALRLLAESPCERRVAVLGDMLELGVLAEEEHRLVGHGAREAVDLLVTFGELAGLIADEAARRRPAPRTLSFSLGELEELVQALRAELRPGDLVLVKGSNALRMDRIVAALCSECS